MMKKRKALLLPMILALSTGVILSSCIERGTSSSPTTSSSVVQGYKVTFDSNGGTAVESQAVEKGGKATRPADPTKAGYTFVGWFLKNGKEWSFIDNAVTEDITLTARWSLNTYNITYHLNGGTNAGTNRTTTYTVEDSFSLEDPIGQFGPSVTVIEGKCYRCKTTFLGWYLDSGFTRPISGITPGMTGNIDVYAKFNTVATDSITLEVYLDNGGTLDDFLNNGGSLEEYMSNGGYFQDYKKGFYEVYDNARYLGTADNPYLVLVVADTTSVTSVTVNENCRFICPSAFYNCTSLTSITIPEGVTSIGDNVFYGCSSLTSITIPDSVTSIGEEVFCYCTSLTYNLYGNAKCLGNANNPYLVLVKADSTSITSVNIHENCRFIGSDAFWGCTSLNSVTIPDGVTSIGDYAFYNCTSLTSVTIPGGVTYIGEDAFRDCTSLTSVTIPDGVTSIGGCAFSGCTSLTYNLYGNAKYLGNANNPHLVLVKADSYSVTSVTIHKNCRFICTDAFNGCTSLTSITIPDGVTSIGDHAFEDCTSLTSITIPNSVTSIGEGAFWGCTSLTSVTIPDGVTSIGGYAFYGCSNLTSVTIPGGVTSIGDSAFYNCASLTSITIPDSVTFIEFEAFRGCTSLTSITIPDSVTFIGYYAFSDCICLTSVFYKGTQEEWDDIIINDFNSCLTGATRYYYSEDDPSTAEGMDSSLNYWHYVDGVPTPWGN